MEKHGVLPVPIRRNRGRSLIAIPCINKSDSLTHLLTHSLTHSFTHSLTHSYLPTDRQTDTQTDKDSHTRQTMREAHGVIPDCRPFSSVAPKSPSLMEDSLCVSAATYSSLLCAVLSFSYLLSVPPSLLMPLALLWVDKVVSCGLLDWRKLT